MRAWIACIRMRAQLLQVGSLNVVPVFSISNAVVLAKSPFYCSSACFAKAFGIAHKLRRCLSARIVTDRQTDEQIKRQTTLTAHARRGLIKRPVVRIYLHL